MKVLSLFDGISVAQEALKELGIECEYYASEIDKYAISLTQKNFPKTIQLGSVTQIHYTDGFLVNEETELMFKTEIDLLIGGSPCQDLSIAKKNREGLSGARSGLFWEYVRILNELKPKYFVLENVNSMPKEAKEVISEALGVQPIMINASLVSAQSRKRLFWVGKLEGDKYVQVQISQPEDKGILLKDILESEVDESFFLKDNSALRILNRGCVPPEDPKVWDDYNKKLIENKCGTLTLPHHNATRLACSNPEKIGYLNKGGQGQRIYSEEGKSVTLSALGGGQGAKTGLYLTQPQIVRVRKYEVPIEELKHTLRTHKNISNKEISEKLEQPITLVEHWFRTDDSFSIPSENIWMQLKELLNIETNVFDESIMTWTEREGTYDQSERVYIGDKAPTLQTGQQIKVVGVASRTYPRIPTGEPRSKQIEERDDDKSNTITTVQQDSMVKIESYDKMGTLTEAHGRGGSSKEFLSMLNKVEANIGVIRKLTPIECERLQSLPDNYTEGVSNTQRYKALGNAFNCEVIKHILKEMKIK